MKKTLCMILLLGMICTVLSGCAEKILGGIAEAGWKAAFGVSQWEQKAMLKHLEEKYGGKFVIKEIHLPENTSSLTHGATVYPEGKEEESFYVDLGMKGDNVCIDNYVVDLQAKRIIPIYEKWIQEAFPDAKVFIRVYGWPDNDVAYIPEEPLEQFTSKAQDIYVDITIAFSEEKLTQKEQLFEELSHLPETEPIPRFTFSSYDIGFFTQDGFEQLTTGMPIFVSTLFYVEEDKEKLKDEVAATSFIDSHESEQWDFLEQLHVNFKLKEDTE